MLHQPFFTTTTPAPRSANNLGVNSLSFLLESCLASLDSSILDTTVERVPLMVPNESGTRQSSIAPLAKTSLRSGTLNWAETQEVQALYYLTGGLTEFAIKGEFSGLAESPCNRWGFDGPLTLSPSTDATPQTDVVDLLPVYQTKVWNLASNAYVNVPSAALQSRASATVLQRSVSGIKRTVVNKVSATFDGYWGVFNVPVMVELFSNGYQIYGSTGALLASSGGTTGFQASRLTVGYTRCYTGERSTILYNDSTGTITFLRNNKTLVLPGLVGAFDSQDYWFFCVGSNIRLQNGALLQDLESPVRGVNQIGQDVYITTDDAVWFWQPTQRAAVPLGFEDYTDVIATFVVGSELALLQKMTGTALGVFIAGSINEVTGFIGYIPSTSIGTTPVFTGVHYTDQGVALNFGTGTTRYAVLFRRDRNEIYVTGGSATFETGLCGRVNWLSGGCGRLNQHLPTNSPYSCTSTDSSDPYAIDLRIVRAVDDSPPFSVLPTYYNAALITSNWAIHYEGFEYTWVPPDPTSIRIPIGVVKRGVLNDLYAIIRTVITTTTVPSYVDTLESLVEVGPSTLKNCAIAGNTTNTQYLTLVAGDIGNGALVWQNHLRGGLKFNERFYLNSRFAAPVALTNWSYDPIHHNTELWTTWDSPILLATPSGVFTAKPGLRMSAVERSTGYDGDSYSYTVPSASVTDLNVEVHVSVGPSAFVVSRPVIAHQSAEVFIATLTPGPRVRMDLYLSGYRSQVKTEGSFTTSDVSAWETKLQATVNLSVQYNCVHAFGGIRCGVDPALEFNVVDAVYDSSPNQIDLLNAPTLPVTRYQFGSLRILTGPFAGMEYSVEGFITPTTLVIAGTIPADITGETILLAVGCRKSFAACTENGNDRYMGFPLVPGSARAYIASTSI